MSGGAAVPPWLPWALLSAVFAAATAILAKIGVQGIDSDLATLVRTILIAIILAAILLATGRIGGLEAAGPRTWLFLSLSALATGASWICYFRALRIGDAARVAPVDKLSVVFVALIGVSLLGERLGILAWIGIMLIAAGSLCVAIG